MSAQRDKFFKEKELQESYSSRINDEPKIVQPAKRRGEGVPRTRKRKYKEVGMASEAGEPDKPMKLREDDSAASNSTFRDRSARR